MAAAFPWLVEPASGGADAVIVKVLQVFTSDQDAAGWNNAAVPV